MHINNPIINAFSINTEILWAINLKWYIYKLVHLNTRQNHTTKSTSNPSVPTPPPLSHLQKTEEQETRKQGKSAGPTAMLLWILAGIIRLKIWTALRLFDELKIIPTSFGLFSSLLKHNKYLLQMTLPCWAHKIHIHVQRNIEAAVLSLRAQSELSHCGRTHTFTQWPTSTT